LIDANGVEICSESFGRPSDPAILLVMGIGTSMLWWDEGFCRLLADGGRFVIRYDHRDTGRSVTYEVGHPGYTGSDLVADAPAVLDAYGVGAAHVVGVSAGGALAQLLALDFPERVLSLVLISTSPATSGDRALPGPDHSYHEFLRTASVDWSDHTSVVDYLVEYARVLAGSDRSFDEVDARALIERDVARAHNIAASENHAIAPEGDVTHDPLSASAVPTLIIHGTADPMFPLQHGQALAHEIPDARLMEMKGMGHGIVGADWEPIATAILNHTTQGERG
jgi:pimeloyl-ACP methyl ester carboxylesterase